MEPHISILSGERRDARKPCFRRVCDIVTSLSLSLVICWLFTWAGTSGGQAHGVRLDCLGG